MKEVPSVLGECPSREAAAVGTVGGWASRGWSSQEGVLERRSGDKGGEEHSVCSAVGWGTPTPRPTRPPCCLKMPLKADGAAAVSTAAGGRTENAVPCSGSVLAGEHRCGTREHSGDSRLQNFLGTRHQNTVLRIWNFKGNPRLGAFWNTEH